MRDRRFELRPELLTLGPQGTSRTCCILRDRPVLWPQRNANSRPDGAFCCERKQRDNWMIRLGLEACMGTQVVTRAVLGGERRLAVVVVSRSIGGTTASGVSTAGHETGAFGDQRSAGSHRQHCQPVNRSGLRRRLRSEYGRRLWSETTERTAARLRPASARVGWYSTTSEATRIDRLRSGSLRPRSGAVGGPCAGGFRRPRRTAASARA